MGSPTQPANYLTIFTFQLNSASQQSPSYNCLLTNAVTTLTDVAIDSAVSLLSHDQNKYAKYLVIADSDDSKINEKWQLFVDQVNNRGIKGKVEVRTLVTIDSSYQWLLSPAYRCSTITYLSHSSKIISPLTLLTQLENPLKYRSVLPERSVLFSSTSQASSGRTILLTNLENVNLEHVTNKEINEHVYIFDAAFLRVITPLNFAYYARYSLQDILIRPILAIVQAHKGTNMPKGTGLNPIQG